jgi:hypothetical protein
MLAKYIDALSSKGIVDDVSEFNKELLTKLCGIPPDNNKFKCFLCGVSSNLNNTTTLHEHFLQNKSHHVGNVLAIVKKSVEGKSRGTTKESNLAIIANLLNPPPLIRQVVPNQPRLQELPSFTDKALLLPLLFNAVLDGGQPLSFVDADWVEKLVDKAVEIGFNARSRNESMPNASKMLPARRQFTPSLDQHCQRVIDERFEELERLAKQYGCTQVSDGRSNIKNDPLLVFGFVAGGEFGGTLC